jgi:type 1 fimbriae regulatory protein FimB/type 1 fimbriae regulatory protein FimE
MWDAAKPLFRQCDVMPTRDREYLTKDEVELLMKAAAKIGRHGQRDRTLILLGYRHGFRISELVGLKWSDVDFSRAAIRCARVKKSETNNHPISGEELRALRQLQRAYPDSQWLFVSERKQPLAARTARLIITRAGEVAELPFPIHPHMLRHACGYQLAAAGTDTRAIQEYLGHKNINHTVRYTKLAPGRFEKLAEVL